jgi:aspartate dehydrogenase
VLRRGIDLLTVSNGALADAAFALELEEAARAGGAQLRLLSGAIGAMDALAAGAVGGLESVVYTGRKPPAGWAGSAAEDVLDLGALREAAVHFEGTAREAALRYPKNANVAATVALAGIGLDETRVRLIADPAATANRHEIEAVGAFGRFEFAIEGASLPGNPASSALTAMSVVRAVRERLAAVSV